MPPQIPLGLELRESASFENFVGRANLELLAQLRAVADAAGEQYLFMWGTAGSGKSQADASPAGSHQVRKGELR